MVPAAFIVFHSAVHESIAGDLAAWAAGGRTATTSRTGTAVNVEGCHFICTSSRREHNAPHGWRVDFTSTTINTPCRSFTRARIPQLVLRRGKTRSISSSPPAGLANCCQFNQPLASTRDESIGRRVLVGL